MDQTDDHRLALIADELERIDGARPGRDALGRKHRKMASNPFHFFRGSAQIFYTDLKQGVLSLPHGFTRWVKPTAIIGDCHMANFGFVTEKGSHGGLVVFVPNDFDDACIGHAAWDLARFVTSIFLACHYAHGILDGRYETDEFDDLSGLQAPSDKHETRAARGFLEAYRETVEAIAENPRLRRSVRSGFAKHHVLAKGLKKARKRSIGGKKFYTKSTLGKAVHVAPAGLCFRDRPGRYKRLDAARHATIQSEFRPYVDDEILDIVERLGAGTGSVNVERYYLLVGPRGASTEAELSLCHVVEVKQQRAAAPLTHFAEIDPRNRLSPAHLTVDLQRLMQREPDLLLDAVSWNGAQWLVRSRHHARYSLDPEEICLGDKPGKRLKQYVEVCGETLALAHARSDHRSTAFETAIASRIIDSGEALIETARAYAARVIADHTLLERHLLNPAG
ncbi:DUF2252 domain-containing protein [Jiella sp. MQZ9-1]|uniref:DUF2252 family protein n=1 Tax=Jiella flava TaxID=2816857 RepID=A0A939JX06_9HYPH|nr:DUF2252 family protein [Jiella flava]MBO0664084.1 DUF2252 family protein [Jiella flava]MCD2472655.1 DUF2252 domain-containing protein [Jiella flava]